LPFEIKIQSNSVITNYQRKMFVLTVKRYKGSFGERDSTGGKSQNKQNLDRPTECKQKTVFEQVSPLEV
jgi:hypothetical protein